MVTFFTPKTTGSPANEPPIKKVEKQPPHSPQRYTSFKKPRVGATPECPGTGSGKGCEDLEEEDEELDNEDEEPRSKEEDSITKRGKMEGEKLQEDVGKDTVSRERSWSAMRMW
jgi:hypothetical protein